MTFDANPSVPDNKSSRDSIPALAELTARIRLALDWLKANGPDDDVRRVVRKLQLEYADLQERALRLAAEVHEVPAVAAEETPVEAPQSVPKPFKYGLTKARTREMNSKRLRFPHYTRELHVWATAFTAPYTTQSALAEACTEDSELSAEAWRKVIRAMLAADMLVMGAAGYVPVGDLKSVDRPQTSKTAKRNLVGKVHQQAAGHRDPSAKANRVRRVMRLASRTGTPFSSFRSLATASSKNGSGSVREYQRIVSRMYAMGELAYDDACFGFGGDTLRLVPDYEL